MDARTEPRLRLLVLADDGRYEERHEDAGGWRVSPVWRGRIRVRFSRDRVGLPQVDLEYEPIAD